MKLDRHIKHQLLETPKITGNYKPDDNLPYFEESLTVGEAEQIAAFLQWVTVHNRHYGYGTLELLWEEWQSTRPRTRHREGPTKTNVA